MKIPKYDSKAKTNDNKQGQDATQASVAAMIATLQEKDSKKGVIKDKDGKVKPRLDSNEVSRYTSIFTLAKKILNPGPEAGQVERTSPEAKTPIGSQLQNASTKDTTTKGGGFDMLKMLKLLGIGAILGGIAIAIKEFLDSFGEMGKNIREGAQKFVKMIKGFNAIKTLAKMFKPLSKVFNMVQKGFKTMLGLGKSVSKFFGGPMKGIMKIGAKMGKMGGGLFKMLAKVGTKLGKTMKFLPFVGSLFSFMASYSAFKEGRYGRGILELLSGVLNLVPGVGTLASGLMDGAMLAYDLLEGDSVSEKVAPIVEGGSNMLKEWGGAIVDKIGSIFGALKDWLFGSVTKTFNNIKDGLKNLLGDYEAPNEFKADPVTYSKKSMKATTSSLNDIKARVGEEEFLKNMGMGVEHRQEWLKSMGFEKSTSIQDKLKKIDDGIITQGGISTRIDSKDQVVAMKSGGPIEQAYGMNNGLIAKLNDINMEGLNQRQRMIQLLETIARQGGGGGIGFSNDSLTSEFAANHL